MHLSPQHEHTTAKIGHPHIRRTPHDDLPPGAEIVQSKSYEIIERLGEGGMGKVYKAYDSQMDRYIALKILKQGVPESEFDRFQQEARITANFAHPNLVRTLETGESNGMRWLAMEHLRGRDIAQVLIRKKNINVRIIVDIYGQILDALHYIHTRNIVHCDIKPENIFITRDSYDARLVMAKLIDFGIARNLCEQSKPAQYISGDPRYMAPEQSVLNQEVDRRADLYALGVCIYECLTLQHPWQDHLHLEPQELLRARLESTALRPSQFLPPHSPAHLHNALDALWLRASAKDPKDRFNDALEMKGALENLCEHHRKN